MSTNLEKRVKNIKDNVSMIQILKDYGLYPFTYEMEDFQMRCPWHAGGKENHPSSHVYGGKTWTCFTCERKNYDVITFVQEKEGFEVFSNALRFIEQKYKLKKIVYDPNEYAIPTTFKGDKNQVSLYDLFKHLEKQVVTMKKSLTLEKFSSLLYVLDEAAKKEDMNLMKIAQAKIKEFKDVAKSQ